MTKKEQLKRLMLISKSSDDYVMRKRILNGEKKSNIIAERELNNQFKEFYPFIIGNIDYERSLSDIKQYLNEEAWRVSYDTLLSKEEFDTYLLEHGYRDYVYELNKINRFKNSQFYVR